MGSTKTITSILPAVMLAAGIAAPGAARAADLLEPPVIEVPEVVTVARGGWYLRGDITYDFNSIDTPHYSTSGTEVDFATAAVDDSFDLGIGIGYQINEYFRADLTGEYVFSSDFNGTTIGFCDAAAIAAGELNCTSTDTTSWTALKLLANAYVDLGTYHGLTPYVGAGIGGAYVSWDDLTNVATCTQVTVVCPTTGGYTGTAGTSTATYVHGGESSWRFAYALHAGFSYDISHSTKVDFGYTYSAISGGEMFQWLDGSGTQGYDRGLDSHVIRAGLRYSW